MNLRLALHLAFPLAADRIARAGELGMAAIPEAIYRPLFRIFRVSFRISLSAAETARETWIGEFPVAGTARLGHPSRT